jgi:hypothetical protein
MGIKCTGYPPLNVSKVRVDRSALTPAAAPGTIVHTLGNWHAVKVLTHNCTDFNQLRTWLHDSSSSRVSARGKLRPMSERCIEGRPRFFTAATTLHRFVLGQMSVKC